MSSKNEEETVKVRTPAGHHTGALGIMAEEGYITIVFRTKDTIIAGGFKVFPNEIKQVVTTARRERYWKGQAHRIN